MRGARVIAAALALAAAPALAQPSGPGFTPLHPVIYEVETMQTGPLTPEILKKAGPIHSLQVMEDLLKANLVPFAWSRRQISAGALPADLTRQMDGLPPHEVFMFRQGQGWIFGVVLARH